MWIIAVLAGVLGVVQSGLSRKLAEQIGLANAVHVSNSVVLIGGLVILTVLAMGHGEFAETLRGKFSFSWWLIIPGLCGLFVVVATPFAVGRIGALPVFVLMIFGQVFGSALWDWKVDGVPFNRYRLLAMVFSLCSALALSRH